MQELEIRPSCGLQIYMAAGKRTWVELTPQCSRGTSFAHQFIEASIPEVSSLVLVYIFFVDKYLFYLVCFLCRHSETNDRNYSQLLDVPLEVYSGCWAASCSLPVVLDFEGVRIGQKGVLFGCNGLRH